MNCAYHSDRPVHGVCSTCGRPICEEDLVNLSGQIHCKPCLEARVHKSARDVRAPIRFVLSVVPGLGHLYMGLFQRGLQFMAVAVIGGVFFDLMRAEPIQGLFIAAMVFFSIFDAREAHLRLSQGLEVEDKGFVDLKTWRFDWNSRYIGYGLIGLGALALYRTLVDDLLTLFFQYDLAYRLGSVLNGVVIGLLAVGAGVWMLNRNFKNS